jgi:hypothetical protein
MTNLKCRPTTCPISDPSAFGGDAVIKFDKGDDFTVRVPATPALLRPDQAGSPSKAR